MIVTHARDNKADVCPMFDADLGRPRGSTRRQIIVCEVPGTFRWRCPDCKGVWQVKTPARQDTRSAAAASNLGLARS